MNTKNTFFKSTAIIGILILVGIILIIVNNLVSVCNAENIKTSAIGKCYYFSSECSEGEQSTSVENSDACVYYGKGFLNVPIFRVILIAIVIGWVCIGIIMILATRKKTTPLDIASFKKEDFVVADVATDLIAMHLSSKWGIAITGNDYKKDAFNFTDKEVFPKDREWHMKCEVDVKEGIYPGIYTIITSLNRGEQWIKNGMYNIKQCLYGDYKRARGLPLHEVQDPQQRLLESVAERSPERAAEIQQQMIEKRLASPTVESQPETAETPIIRRAPYRRYTRQRYVVR